MARHIKSWFIGICFWALICHPLTAQEQIDPLDVSAKVRSEEVAKMTVRVRVSQASPKPDAMVVTWKSGGEGLGGEVIKGEFASVANKNQLSVGEWSAWLPLSNIVGNKRDWEFGTIAVMPGKQKGKKGGKKNVVGLEQVSVDFEFAEQGKVFKSINEPAPNGATVSFAFPGGHLSNRRADDPEFVALLQGLSSYVRSRRERVEKLFPEGQPLPKQFGILGHLGGYGEGTGSGKKGGSGYGVRHCNPEILADEARTLHLLGFNGLSNPGRSGGKNGEAEQFQRIHWGGPGAASPMTHVQKSEGAEACPFDPNLKKAMAARVSNEIEEYHAARAKESWAEWWDEIGVAAKAHVQSCPRCAAEYRTYLKDQHLQPEDFGKASWDEVHPQKIFKESNSSNSKKGKNKEPGMAQAPADRAGALNFYYTFRFLTYATARLFPEAAQQFKTAGIKLYAMQSPAPSWNGHSLDWHEFYDLGANTALVFETSNRDPQVWQMESYLADIARGITERHEMAFGCLVKPHRGAPLQRMLAVVARGATVLEWYTYGPDYFKGDSFSQRPGLIDKVGQGGRFLGRAEDYLFGAHFAEKPEVAFVSPRSAEIWGKATSLGITAFEDAKWIYLALAHEHIPVDVLSEQQLAEGKLDHYKVIYVIGPNLRNDAAEKLRGWVRAGGTMWTDALGCCRDEANQSVAANFEMCGIRSGQLETYGSVEPYKAINLHPFEEAKKPALVTVPKTSRPIQACVGRELLAPATAKTLMTFNDGKPALLRNSYGQGEVYLAGFWAGLSYSADVRNKTFNLRMDYNPALRSLIAQPGLARKVYRPAVPSEPLVEAIALEKDGRKSIALINWAYSRSDKEAGGEQLEVMKNVRISIAQNDVKAVRSLFQGELKVENGAVVLPELKEIDLLILE